MLACGSAAFEQCRLDVNAFVARIGERQFTELYAWALETGWGEEWQQAGLIAATILNVNRSSEDQKLFKPEDVIPKLSFSKPGEAAEQQVNLLAAMEQALAARFGKGSRKQPAVIEPIAVPAQQLGPPKGWQGPPRGVGGSGNVKA